MLIVIPKAVLKANTSRNAASFNVCIGATWLGSGTPTTAQLTWNLNSKGKLVPAVHEGTTNVYWGVATNCSALPPNDPRPCVAVRSKQAIDVQNYFGWTPAQVATYMKDSDLGIIIRKNFPWDGKGGVY